MSISKNKSTLTMLALFAHPDDEVFSCGGIMLLNHARGIRNVLVCATKGEAGEISLEEYATASNLGQVREQELKNATALLMVDELHFLGYRDSGMAGSDDNRNPHAFANASPSAVVHRLVHFIRTVRPQIILTFDPTGGYGHPDHIAIHKHTVAAYHAAADPAYDPALGEAWQAERLFYPTFSKESMDEFFAQLVLEGIQPPNWDSEGIEFNGNTVHGSVDVSEVIQRKWEAFKSHRTQFGPENPFIQVSEAFALKWLSTELFELAWPENKPESPFVDLFEGIVDEQIRLQ